MSLGDEENTSSMVPACLGAREVRVEARTLALSLDEWTSGVVVAKARSLARRWVADLAESRCAWRGTAKAEDEGFSTIVDVCTGLGQMLWKMTGCFCSDQGYSSVLYTPRRSSNAIKPEGWSSGDVHDVFFIKSKTRKASFNVGISPVYPIPLQISVWGIDITVLDCHIPDFPF